MANPQKENGHVDIANELVEALAKTYLSSYESQVLWAIFRKTYGWHKKEDWITNTQITEMTGIAESHVSRTIKKLIKRNIVSKNGKKLFFQKNYDKWEKIPKQVSDKKIPIQDIKLPEQVIKVTQTGIEKLPKQVDTKEIKETLTKEIIQKVQNTNFKNLIKNSKEEPKKANHIEFDFELWSWHGIDDDIKDRWIKIFPNVDIEIELNKIREYFKKHSGHENMIKEKFNNNYANYIFDWLARAEKYIKEKGG